MSNYFAMVHDAHLTSRVDGWLRQNRAAAHELALDRMRHHRRLVLITAGGPSEFQARSVVIGTVLDTVHPAIGFGTHGWAGLKRPDRTVGSLSGEFVRITWNRRALAIERDFLGSVALLETSGDGWVAFSDSLLVLADLRKALGEAITMNGSAAIARSRTLAITSQQMSPATLLNEISFVPGGHGRRALAGREIQVQDIDQNLAAGDSGAPVEPILQAAAANVVGMVRAAAAHPEIVPALGLSGGLDSRVILAALRRANALQHGHIESWNRTKENVADFQNAQLLSRVIGIDLNSSEHLNFGDPEELADSPLLVWASSSLGLYDRVLPKSGVRHRPRSLRMSGLSAEILKGNYGWRSLRELDRRYHEEIQDRSAIADRRRDSFLEQVAYGMAAIGADPEAADASEWHYACYRAGLHGAAHAGSSLFALRPLQQRELLAMAHVPSPAANGGASFAPSAGAIRDMLIIIDEQLASQPFADPANDMAQEQVRSRQLALGGRLCDDAIPEYSIHGDPATARRGPTLFGMSIATRWGFDLPRDARSVLGRAQDLIDGLPDADLRTVYGELHRVASSELLRQGKDVCDAGPATAKLLSAVVLARS